MVTDNQVNKQREKNDSLRKKIADLNEERARDEASEANASKLSALKNEEAALKQELEFAERLAAARKAKADREVESEPVVVVGAKMQTTPDASVGNENKEN